MRQLLTVLLVVVAFGVGPVRSAEALTIRDVLELSRAGLGDDVLLALIEVNPRVYTLDPATLIALKQAGVSDRVIAALVRSGREQPPAGDASWAGAPDEPAMSDAALPQPSPTVVVIDHHAAPEVREVPVPVPVYVAVPTARVRHRGGSRSAVESTYEPFQTGPPPHRPVTPQPSPQPVYWGFGGKLRPDAWQPSPAAGKQEHRQGGEARSRPDGEGRGDARARESKSSEPK